MKNCIVILFIAVTGMLVFIMKSNAEEKFNDTKFSPNELKIKEKIHSFAQEMKVLPLNVVAPKEKMESGDALYSRYDVTVKRYRVFYEFKKWVQRLERDDFLLLPSLAERLQGKERSLVLMGIYLYEIPNNPELRPIFQRLEKFYEKKPPKTNITEDEWSLCVDVYAKYKDDDTLAFPAIKTYMGPVSAMNRRTKVSQKLRRLCMEMGYYNSWEPEEMRERYSSGAVTQRLSRDADEVLFLMEYLEIDNVSAMLSGVGSYHGNSSEKPKTVGDIATQILSSRKWMLE